MLVKKFFFSGLLFAAILTTAPLQAAELNIKLTEVKSNKGQIMLAVYDSKASFSKTPVQAVSIPATPGEMDIKLEDLPAGKYAVMLYQDIDGNNKLKKNMLGLPREPWGGSLGGKPVFGPPTWKSTCFELLESGTQITIKLR